MTITEATHFLNYYSGLVKDEMEELELSEIINVNSETSLSLFLSVSQSMVHHIVANDLSFTDDEGKEFIKTNTPIHILQGENLFIPTSWDDLTETYGVNETVVFSLKSFYGDTFPRTELI